MNKNWANIPFKYGKLIFISLGVYFGKKIYILYKSNADFKNELKLDYEDVPKVKAMFSISDKKRLKENCEMSDEILNFRKILMKNIDYKNLNLFNKNLKTLKAKQCMVFPENFLGIPLSGGYYFHKNEIRIKYLVKDVVLNHELLHMASTYYNKNKKMVFSGFSQNNLKTGERIGDALNEGYTELLNKRMFNVNTDPITAYKICTIIAENLEIIVGKKDMEKFYFNADLNSLIKTLEKYDERKNIIDFLSSIDYILNYYEYAYGNIFKKVPKVKNLVDTQMEKVKLYLKKWYITKNINNYVNDGFCESIDNCELLKEKDYFKEKKEFFKSLLD
ncbi:MAG: hypothetical protein Q4E75_00415 [bacterium]|nr:hypothetical protein [bacterium]